MPAAPTIELRPVGHGEIPDFVKLFGPSGACYGCWCQHFRLPPRLRTDLPSEAKRDLMLDRIRRGPPPGIMAWLDGVPSGWMQIGPRADVPEWNNPRRATTPLPDARADDPGVWAITCFFFARRARAIGLSHRMVAEGIGFARENGARMIEASPMDRAKSSASLGLFVGSTSVFRKAGFVEVARQKPGRPLMRLVLAAPSLSGADP